jgi:hypothetical protein
MSQLSDRVVSTNEAQFVITALKDCMFRLLAQLSHAIIITTA